MLRMQKRWQKTKRRYVAAHRRRVHRVKRFSRKPQFTIPFATFLIALAVTMSWLMLSGNNGTGAFRPSIANVVVLNYEDEARTIPTDSRTVGELLQRLDIRLNDGDVVEPSQETPIIGDNFRVNVYKAVPVTIIDGDKRVFTYSAAATPRSIAQHAGVQVYPEDRLTLQPVENFLEDSSIGEQVVVDRSTPINVNLYGTPVVMRTHAKTVGELLKEKNIALDKDDTAEPALNTVLTAATPVALVRHGTQVQTVTEDIPAPVETIDDDSLTFGVTVVRQQGAAGKKIVTYQVNYQNNQETARQKLQEIITQEPVKQVVAVGSHFDIDNDKTSLMAAIGIPKSDYPYVDYIISHESGWCYTKWQGEYGACRPYHGAPTSAGVGYGLCQATPGYKMASAGADWASNPLTQLRWCTSYASRYGGWAGSYAVWTAREQQGHGWW